MSIYAGAAATAAAHPSTASACPTDQRPEQPSTRCFHSGSKASKALAFVPVAFSPLRKATKSSV